MTRQSSSPKASDQRRDRHRVTDPAQRCGRPPAHFTLGSTAASSRWSSTGTLDGCRSARARRPPRGCAFVRRRHHGLDAGEHRGIRRLDAAQRRRGLLPHRLDRVVERGHQQRHGARVGNLTQRDRRGFAELAVGRLQLRQQRPVAMGSLTLPTAYIAASRTLPVLVAHGRQQRRRGAGIGQFAERFGGVPSGKR
ncbi:MAG: hypothetical protein M5U09_26675 [Gammaproteobacteria bacterium]|nr:hypothetical protein [Gammaproteobacteria bacterium]